MTNEENYLNSRLSRETPFRVPEGYFDRLTGEVMAKLPEKKPARRFMLRPWLAAASIACVAIAGVGLYFNRQAAVPAEEPQTAAVVLSDSYIDEAADYAMMDHQDIYACLTSDY